MSAPRKITLIAWASGMLEFLFDEFEPDGAIRICTVTSDGSIKACPISFLLDTVHHHAELHDFGGKVALKVPGINPGRPDIGAVHDTALDYLIAFDELLFDEIGDDPAFDFERHRGRAA